MFPRQTSHSSLAFGERELLPGELLDHLTSLALLGRTKNQAVKFTACKLAPTRSQLFSYQLTSLAQ
jgi:hypothetical protein